MSEQTAPEPLTPARAALAAAARELAATGVAPSTAGNLSVREGDLVAITGGGVQLSAMTPERCVVVDLDGEQVAGAGRPSSETQLHLAAGAATGAAAVVHSHAPFATTLAATLSGELPVVHYSMHAFGGPVRIAPYERFGTGALADSVRAALQDRSGALMANHGAVVVAPTLAEAVEKMVLLEWMCEVTWRALLLGSPRLIESDELDAVGVHSRALRYGRADA